MPVRLPLKDAIKLGSSPMCIPSEECRTGGENEEINEEEEEDNDDEEGDEEEYEEEEEEEGDEEESDDDEVEKEECEWSCVCASSPTLGVL